MIYMEKVCPSCNKLELVEYKCKSCGTSMMDLGRAQEVYQDDYTANMPINDAYNYCVHVFSCSGCGYREKFPVNKIVI
jgi:hypothetical protein